MRLDPRAPWQPDPRWADALIILLVTLATIVGALSLISRARTARRPSEQVSLQGRLTEVVLAGPQVLLGRPMTAQDWDKTASRLSDPWDRALVAVLRRELETTQGPQPLPTLSGEGGAAFRRVSLGAFEHGPLPSAKDRREVQRRLGRGYGAALLEARLQDQVGPGTSLRAEARRQLWTRLLLLVALGLAVLGLGVGGLGLGLTLLATRRPPSHPLPTWGLSGRAAAIVFLVWFLAFFAAGNLVGVMLLPWPTLRWLGLPLGYLLQAGVGVRLITWAEGISLGELWHRLAPGKPGKDLAWGGAFVALAVFLVIAVALLTRFIPAPEHNPQRELQELLQGLRGWPSTLLMFLTVAGLAPLFEEILFRGFLLPILSRGGRMGWALLATALLFGAIHLQPAGLLTLATLGWVLGLAMRQTGSLRTPVLLHACWNGGLFLLMRGLT